MRVEALIDSEALQHNLEVVRRLVPTAKILAMVKANAYGHEILLCAETLAADFLGVATLEEAYTLRFHGISKRILLTPGFQNEEELNHIIDLELDTIVHYPHQVEILQHYRGNYRLPVWFKFNTGMHRLGFAYDEALEYLRRLEKLTQIEIICLMSHLSLADQPNNAHTLMQIERFKKFTQNLSYPKSILNSAGIINYQDAANDIVRPGLLLYGASPVATGTAASLGVKPVMTLQAAVLAKVKVAKGESVGYGNDWTAPKNSELAVIACGYGDGYPQKPKAGQVYYRGQLLPIVGRVSMDFLTVDVTACKHEIAVGDIVELWGKNLYVNDAAKAIGTEVYPLLTSIMARVERKDVAALYSYQQAHQKLAKKPSFKFKN